MTKTLCPRCMCEETIQLNLDDGDTMTCGGCSEEFTVDDLESLIESWAALLPWLRQHPARQQPSCVKAAG